MNLNLEFFLIYSIGTVFVLLILRYIMVAQNILGMSFKMPVSKLINREECPEYLQKYYAEKEKEIL